MDVVPTIETPAGDDPLFDGRYRVLRELGRGGFGRVLLVEDMLHSGQVRALKTVLPVRQAHGDFERRFRNEIQVMRSLQHPGIPQIYNDGKTADGEFYFTMRFVEGRPFSKVLTEQGALESQRVARILRQIVDVLDFAHGKGVVHRDLKPDNILLEDDDSVRVLDFGIAKILEHEGDLEDAVSMQTQAPIGTPHYMSPEQVSGGEINGSTDVYALGILVYQLLSGRFPFQGTTYMELMAARLHERPEPLSRKLEPTWARELVPRLMDRDSSKRPTAAQLRDELDAIIAGKKVAASGGKGRAYALAGIGGAGLIALAIAFALSGDPGESDPPSDDDVETGAVTAKVEDRSIDVDDGEGTEAESKATPRNDVEGDDVTTQGDEPGDGAREGGVPADEPSADTDPKQEDAAEDDGPVTVAVPPPTKEEKNESPAPALDDPKVEPVEDEASTEEANDEAESATRDQATGDADAAAGQASAPDPEPEQRPEPPRELPSGTVAVGDELTDDRWPRTIRHEASGLELVFVEAGESQGVDGLIQLDRPIYLGRTEVSRLAFQRYSDALNRDMPDAPRDPAPVGEHPVVAVTRDDAAHFASWCGGRLPRYGELRWAATGPAGLAFPWGDACDTLDANFKGADDGFAKLAPVDAFAARASWCGALNLCGNVVEWVEEEKFLFGGSYQYRPESPRKKPTEVPFKVAQRPDLGFRIVIDLPSD